VDWLGGTSNAAPPADDSTPFLAAAAADVKRVPSTPLYRTPREVPAPRDAMGAWCGRSCRSGVVRWRRGEGGGQKRTELRGGGQKRQAMNRHPGGRRRRGWGAPSSRGRQRRDWRRQVW
jgi:hypothetical protein